MIHVTEYKHIKHNLSDDDYILIDGRAWFTVGNRSVRIVNDEDGRLHVSVFELHQEMNEPIADLTV